MYEPLDAGTLATLTAAIVAAYLTHHPVAKHLIPYTLRAQSSQ